MTHRQLSTPSRAVLGFGLGMLALGMLGSSATPAFGQGSVAFQPTISTFPDGATLNATAVVSADRRYVRLGVQPTFTGLLGFDSFSIPAAVTGGGINGGFGGGGGGGAGGFPSFGPGIGAGPWISNSGYQVPDFGTTDPLPPVASPGEVAAVAQPRPRPSASRRSHSRRIAPATPVDPDAAMSAAIATATAGKAPDHGDPSPNRRSPRRSPRR